jgi:dienelactone hydrolase
MMRIQNIKPLLFFICCLGTPQALFAQKKSIDSTCFNKLEHVNSALISNDGSYVSYNRRNFFLKKNTLVVQSTDNKWKFELKDTYGDFTQDSKRMILKKKDSLGIVVLGSPIIKYIPNVLSYKTPENGKGEWLAYQLKNERKDLVLLNLKTDNQRIINGVKSFSFTKDGNNLLLQTTSIELLDLVTGKNALICSGTPDGNLVFDNTGTQLAFIVKGSLFYYKKGMDKAIKLVDSYPVDSFKLENVNRFSNNGNSIFLSLIKPKTTRPLANEIKVDVWSYTDAKLQSQQLKEINAERNYAAIVNIADPKIIRLEKENEVISYSRQDKEDFVLVLHSAGDYPNEWNWNKAAESSIYLVSTKNGSRKLLGEQLSESIAGSYRLSPKGKYVIYYDVKTSNYYAYDIAKSTTRNITKDIPTVWTQYETMDHPTADYYPISLAGWGSEDAEVILYDRNDIWKVNLAGHHKPVNMTNGYGAKHHIVFRALMDDTNWSSSKILLSAFDRTNKNDGFASLIANSVKDPEILSMQPYLFTGVTSSELDRTPPIKAKDAGVYLVLRQGASESPNYLITKDFKSFKPMSDRYPEKAYNWLSSELIDFKNLDGTLNQGILYKPENFDPSKKYSIIFYYYERFSETLNKFLRPEASIASINIPYYVSNGYLVCVPDIPKIIGYPGKSALNAVEGAAKYLMKRPYISATKMGIQGHSFGGFETNYIITHSGLFAAAMSASSMSDFISCYGSILSLRDGTSRQRQYEINHDAMGASLWQSPDLYIENSPVLVADEITTPVLMMNNIGDSDVPFAQGIEFFTALRRLGKRAWMLQYDGGDHMVSGKQAEDLTIRMKQFFDHYLMDKPAPKWMTRGIPAKMKGIDDGLEPDYEIKTPGPGLLTEEEKKKIDTYSKIPLGEKLKPLMKNE